MLSSYCGTSLWIRAVPLTKSRVIVSMLMRVLKRLVNERRESRFLKGIENFDFSMTIAPTVNCGRGVFATRQIVAGTLLGVYPGRMVS
ncbi:MAG: hypothetical protein KDD53_05300, partial [Bdellovibrionales bacterium]|nr:hypothetical protein [Bdellovibrionales bacterium]